MAPKSPKKRPLKVQAKPVRTPQEDREERARRREEERDADEDSSEDETEGGESEDLQLPGVDGLSSEELRKLMSAMEVLSKLTPDARSALNSRPLQTIARVDELSHSEQVTKIATLVDRYVEPCFDRETFDLYRSSKDLCAERPEFWSRLFAGIRPDRSEMLPSVTQYPHCSLIDLRPIKPVGDVETALKAKSKDLAQEELLFKILSKPMVPLHRMIIPALELANMPDLTAEYDDDFDPDIKRALSASSSLLRSFAIHTLALHSDLMHRRKILAMTALGASKHEAEGVRNVLDSYDRAKLKDLAEQRKERAILAGSLKRKAPEGGQRRGKGGGRGRGRNRYRNREGDSSPQHSRGKDSGGEKADYSAEKSSKDGSNKSTSTPKKKPFQRGKGK